jgi:hypothetical protein
VVKDCSIPSTAVNILIKDIIPMAMINTVKTALNRFILIANKALVKLSKIFKMGYKSIE